MTRDATRPADNAQCQISVDADILAGLWEEAPFARLPWDTPTELKELVEDVENPKRVYAIYRASRRHNFQQLVQRYIVQLRDGCNSPTCSTPTCFSCRKRVAGTGPIRRYNTTSARTLAVYLASQDNPEGGLCPALQSPKSSPAALNSLVFSPRRPSQSHDVRNAHVLKGQNGYAKGSSRHEGLRPTVMSKRPQLRQGEDDHAYNKPARASSGRRHSDERSPSPNFRVTEKPASKDHRSFAANVFGTVTFKMMEWLTPNAMEDLSQKAQAYQGNGGEGLGERGSPSTSGSGTRSSSATSRSTAEEASLRAAATRNKPQSRELRKSSESVDGNTPLNHTLPVNTRPSNPRRNSNATVLTSPSTKPKRRLSIEHFPLENGAEENASGFKLPLTPGLQMDKPPWSVKSANATLPRPIALISPSEHFKPPLETMPPKVTDIKTRTTRPLLDGTRSSESDHFRDTDSTSSSAGPTPCTENSLPLQSRDSLYPQSLSRLNAEVIDFFCDVLQDDETSEAHVLEPSKVTKFHTRYSRQGNPLERRTHPQPKYTHGMKIGWKLFVEQSLFYVLSDPQALIRSFTKKSQLYDSHTLWYCMLRMTRVAPSLVFHSLWMAAALLFAPPKALQSLRSPASRLFPKQDNVLNNLEAGRLMSICLHALVAAAPLINDHRLLYDMSRMRSHGMSLSAGGAVSHQPPELCLQYDDAFTNDLAMRLARRLFAAITARRYFDIMELEGSCEDGLHGEADILDPLFAQLDFLNADAVYILNFSFPDRAVHETRVPTLLLDWARAVMLNDWDGKPQVPGDGSFGGALRLIEAMYNKRQELLLGDAQFRSEYFAERLDLVEMPVSWLSYTSTRQKLHLLDFPYIFNPATLVSYFRSINFSRMSRAYEESSSLQSRMGAIISPGSLIINPHHKNVLQDKLRVASSKFLVLDIKRTQVIQDAFNQLWRREERELLRPLKVHLGEDEGEEGFDSGGVQQEFFRLAIAEALQPDAGMFTVDDRTRMAWFQPGSSVEDFKFELVGLLVSLAVYNGLTLPITFPRALYKKLLDEPVTDLHHIEDGWPDLCNGLTGLLEWDVKDGLVEDVFARTYEFSVSMFGQPVSREMNTAVSAWPQFSDHGAHPSEANPDDAPLVTAENRHAYVSDYIAYLTDISVRPQYEAFARGFRACLHPKSLTLLTSSLLQGVVEGTQEIDVAELRRHARYVGWDAAHRTVRDFWSVVRRYDEGMRRKLLEFVTASDRVPVGGMKNLQFVVQRNGAEEGEGGHLPTAYTCYGTLLLPEYRDKEVLRERLAMALENAQGFGFA